MWPFKNASNEDVEEAKEAADSPGTVGLPPPTYLRVLRQPLYDTEWAIRGTPATTLFSRPIGQLNQLMAAKTDVDTNMVQAACLPVPMQFDWFSWRTEFATDVAFECLLNFRFASRLQVRFGQRVWFSVPLSYVPFTHHLAIWEMNAIAPIVLSADDKRFKEAWRRAEVVDADKIPDVGDLLKDTVGIYRTEHARRIGGGGDNHPMRIRSQEVFMADIFTDWSSALVLPDQVGVRLYLEGNVYQGL